MASRFLRCTVATRVVASPACHPSLRFSAQKKTRHHFRRWATTSSGDSVSFPNDPANAEAIRTLEEGTKKLEEGDIDAAKALYERSIEIKPSASALFNLGVTHYHEKKFTEAIEAWHKSIALEPNSPDAHTNLASAHIMSPIPRPDLALQHLKTAVSISPEDPEIAFNLGAVLEACGFLEEALEQYKRSNVDGIERADVHVRNVSAKILGRRMKELEETEEAKKHESS